MLNGCFQKKERESIHRDQELLQRHYPQQLGHDQHPQGGDQEQGRKVGEKRTASGKCSGKLLHSLFPCKDPTTFL
jgi:hypothetical protein